MATTMDRTDPSQEPPLPVRARALTLLIALVTATTVSVALPVAPVRAAAPKVAIIVGPVGSLSDTYRSFGNQVANAATAAGATVVKAYSPNATWANVKAAVNGANIIVYFGHGNGFPSPYSSTENLDRVNGWGLNRTTTNGDADAWTSTLAYCGERVLLGNLTSADDSVRQNYCGGTANDGITPAPGFTMIYAQAHYAPGFGERYQPSDPEPTLAEGQQRVRNYSYPVLRLGARGYIATAYGDADDIVRRVITQPSSTYGDIFRAGEGYAAAALKVMPHPDIAGAEVWVQKTAQGSNMHFGDPDYWYAFAGDPTQTPDGSGGAPFNDIAGSPFYEHIVWLVEEGISTGCSAVSFCPRATVTRAQMAAFISRALSLPAATQDYFTDDNGVTGESAINRLAEAGIAQGCGPDLYCPNDPVPREQMASFVARALDLPENATNFFSDDEGSIHEPDINRFAGAGITSGCMPGLYCPADTVTREQMAAFLHRALD
jgi:hypothetical protein